MTQLPPTPLRRPARIFWVSFALIWAVLLLAGAWSMSLGSTEAHADVTTDARPHTPLVEAQPTPQDSAAAEATDAPNHTHAFEAVPSEAPAHAPEAATSEAPAHALEAAPSTQVSLSGGSEETPWQLRLYSLAGVFGFLLIAWLLSNNRRRINWRTVAVGLTIQLLLAVFIHRTQMGAALFAFLGKGVTTLLGFSAEGTRMLFGSFVADGQMMPALLSMAFVLFPSIIFFSSLMAIFYHLGAMQRLVGLIAGVMRRTMGTSGPESLSAAANIFVGQIEAPLMVGPYVRGMTRSELMAVMTGGFATVAGGVMASYVGFLHTVIPDIANHLLAASVMAAPGALVIAKIMVPETASKEELPSDAALSAERRTTNMIDAAATGAVDGMNLALMVGAVLLAFVALVALLNATIATPSHIQHGVALKQLWGELTQAGVVIPDALQSCAPDQTAMATRSACVRALESLSSHSAPVFLLPTLSLQGILGVLFWPIAAISGVPLPEVRHLAELYGQKLALNEFLAYLLLLEKVQDPEVQLSSRTIVMASYGLCGFANISSIAVQIGGIGGIAPERRSELASLGLKAMFAGSLTSWMCASIAGVLL